jgi:hypothetical protein
MEGPPERPGVSSTLYETLNWGVMARIFINYANPDLLIADEVSGWLRAAGISRFSIMIFATEISVGEAWKERLYRELREVDAVIGAVTSVFGAPTRCSAEVGIACAGLPTHTVAS